MAASSIDNSRAHFAEIAGFSRSRTRALMAATVISSIFGAMAGTWAWVEAISSRDRVKTFVVYLDNQSQVVGMAGLDADWNPEDGVYLDLAWRWVYNFRSRPRDTPTLSVQRGQLKRSTGQALYDSLGSTLAEADETVKKTAAIQVTNLTVNMLNREDRARVILATWDEQIMSGGNKPVKWTATIRMVHDPVREVREMNVNPIGVYVVEYQASSREGA